ncbi:MAG: T9SS type A sorting domain-containing protein, partial [Rhodothermales bacterium]|nr:T9SS type A sorting domain-containing protein [Rhodothermales bacterium]
ASENGNAGFAVEYAQADTDSWTELSFIESAGNTKSETGYTYRASDLGFGAFKFRLRQVDVDGSASYSAEVEVSIDVPNEFVLGSPYPNPFNPSASFTLAIKEQQEVRVELYNMLGQMIEVLHDGVLGSNQTHTFSIDGASLSSGMYLVRIAGDNFTTTQTATLLK